METKKKGAGRDVGVRNQKKIQKKQCTLERRRVESDTEEGKPTASTYGVRKPDLTVLKW